MKNEYIVVGENNVIIAKVRCDGYEHYNNTFTFFNNLDEEQNNIFSIDSTNVNYVVESNSKSDIKINTNYFAYYDEDEYFDDGMDEVEKYR